MTRPPALALLRVVVPAGILATLLALVPLHDVAAAATAVPLRVLAAVAVIYATMLAVAALRWRVLFAAAGMPGRPRLRWLYRLYWVGSFYGTYVPGGVGGEVVRATATRHLTGEGGLAAALALVLLERTLGVAALLIVAGAGLLLLPLPDRRHLALWSGLGLCVTAAGALALTSGPRLARHLPTPLARIAATLPAVRSRAGLALALGLSLLTQLGGVVIGHLVITGIAPVPWRDSLAVLPLANAATFFPLSLGGVGAREAAFVVLYGLVGVQRADALAAALVITVLAYALNGIGGVLHMLRPIAPEPPR